MEKRAEGTTILTIVHHRNLRISKKTVGLGFSVIVRIP